MIVAEIIARWYKQNARNLPWRNSADPYKIWVSEIILQQTRVNQGLNYYVKFINEFPSVKVLAESSIDRLMNIWQGLGYYSRARNMHQTANVIVNNYNCVFPDDFDELKKLKGIGDYTAAAIASIAFNKPAAVVDGNVFRILSRYYGIGININSSKGKNYFYLVANEILDKKSPGLHNQALMEMGAILCLPSSPQCDICPLSNSCIAFSTKSINKYPVKLKKQKIKERYFNYIIIKKGEKVLIRKRSIGDIWALLYEFPLIETPTRVNPEDLCNLDDYNNLFNGARHKIVFISEEYRHQLTHRIIYVRFFEIEVDNGFNLSGFAEVNQNELAGYAFPVIIGKYLSSNFHFYISTYK